MVDIEDVARWLSGRSVWWPFAALALLVLTDVAVGTSGWLGVLGVPGSVVVAAYETIRNALVGPAALGGADPLGIAALCYVVALVVGAFDRTLAAAWYWRRGLLYPEEHPYR